jgi:hypothetical protein
MTAASRCRERDPWEWGHSAQVVNSNQRVETPFISTRDGIEWGESGQANSGHAGDVGSRPGSKSVATFRIEARHHAIEDC